MGKSPGKWIKTVFFGKKSSKSHTSKDVTSGRKISSVAKAPTTDLAENPSVFSEPAPQATNPNSSVTNEVGFTSAPTSEVTTSMQVADGQHTTSVNSADEGELSRQHQAATKAQAAFRGYLARRAFWALKGIIRLQALVRGHLVRRQAVATLQCMHAIVKFQALVRGRIVRHSDIGHEVYYKSGEPMDKAVDMLQANMFLGSMKQSSNPFVRKLLSSSPIVMPLSLQYDLEEPNSASKWLERWSSSGFWVPLARPKKIVDGKPRRKQASVHSAEIEAVRPKRSVRKIPAMNGDSSKLHISEHEKPKRNPRKPSNHQPESAQEQPQTELEKVKRNLRKVSSSALVPSDVPEAATEKPRNNHRRTLSSALLPFDVAEAAIEKPQNTPGTHSSALVSSDVPESATDKSQNNQKETPGSPRHDATEQVDDHFSETPSDFSVPLPIQPVAEILPESLEVGKPLDLLCENLSAVEIHSLDNSEKVDNSPKVNEDPSSKEDKTGKESQKRRRRKSTPLKHEYPECVSQNSSSLPSYMQATESAKAKLRAQEAQRFGDDEAENCFIRRHSLPASTNVKLSTPSPRMQKPLQANGKGGSKTNRSLTSSRDDKSLQTGWKR